MKNTKLTIIACFFFACSLKTYAQDYLRGHFGYFTSELSYGTNISHEHPDTMAFALELTIDSLQLLDSITITLSDSMLTTNFHRNVGVVPNADTSRYLDIISPTLQVPIDRPHIFRVTLPAIVVPSMQFVAVRFKLKTGAWVNVLNKNLQ